MPKSGREDELRAFFPNVNSNDESDFDAGGSAPNSLAAVTGDFPRSGLPDCP
jgi:hypothetical protein